MIARRLNQKELAKAADRDRNDGVKWREESGFLLGLLLGEQQPLALQARLAPLRRSVVLLLLLCV
jgi:hypothetical protein